MPFLQRVEFWVVAAYLLLMIAIGIRLASRNRGGLDYFAGGRAIPWWVSGISLYMGNFSAWFFTGGAGMIYQTTGYGILYFLLTGSVAYFLGSRLSAARWRRSRVISPVEFTRQRFGIATQQVLGIVTAVVFLAAAGNQLKAIAFVVNSILGVPLAEAAIVIGVIVVLYTLIGGLWAVVVTDVVQFVVLLAVTILIAPLAIMLATGGLQGVLDQVSFSVPAEGGEPWHDLHFLVAGLISFTLGVGGGQGPRFYCVPDERSARKVGMLAAALFLTTPLLFSIPSLVARSVWGGPATLGEAIPGPAPHEQVFVRIAMEVLPPGLLGIFLAAMFAATMSALDSVYNMVASVLSRDVYMGVLPRTSDRALIGVGRGMTLLCGASVIGLALLYIRGSSDLFTVMTTIFYVSTPVLTVPVLLGLLVRKAPRAAAMASILWGIGAGLTSTVLLGWPAGPQTYLTQAMMVAIFLLSPWLGRLWKTSRGRITGHVLAVVFAALTLGVLLIGSPVDQPVVARFGELAWTPPLTTHQVIGAYAAFTLLSLVLFARRFSRPEDRAAVDAFYVKLDTPVDVSREVTGSAAAALSVYRLVGGLTFLVAGMVLLLMIVEVSFFQAERAHWWKYVVLIGILSVLGALFALPGRKVASDET